MQSKVCDKQHCNRVSVKIISTVVEVCVQWTVNGRYTSDGL